MQHVSKLSLRGEVANSIRRVFSATDQVEAKGLIDDAVTKYESTEPKLAAWTAENLFESLAVLQIPVAHRKRLRTSNAVERLNREIKRRTKVASIFPNTESLLRLVTALAIEVSDEWETGRIYLTMEPR
jgi:putative transposase